MQNHPVHKLARGRVQDEPQSALSYWGTGLGCIAAMLAICIFAGLRF